MLKSPMGKRGPKPTRANTATLSTWIEPQTRAALVKAAEKGGRTLSAEVELRLRRSFIEDENLRDLFGDSSLYALFRIAALAMKYGGETEHFIGAQGRKWFDDESAFAPPSVWLLDPVAFDQAISTMIETLQNYRPSDVEVIRSGIPKAVADLWTNTVAEADPSIPSPAEKLDDRQKLIRRIAVDLGEIGNKLRSKKK